MARRAAEPTTPADGEAWIAPCSVRGWTQTRRLVGGGLTKGRRVVYVHMDRGGSGRSMVAFPRRRWLWAAHRSARREAAGAADDPFRSGYSTGVGRGADQ